MRTHVALLRGINVLGRNQVSMAALRDVVAGLGHEDVATYIQSGNVVFSAARARTGVGQMADELEAAIAARLSVRPAVVVLDRRQLRQVVTANAFPGEEDHRKLHAVFFREPPASAQVVSVREAVGRARRKHSRDDAVVVGRVLYLWTPDGFGRSVLRAELSRGGQRSPMGVGTARNWATVTTLLTLLS